MFMYLWRGYFNHAISVVVMKWKTKKDEFKIVVVNTTTLADFDEERCRYCGRYGCTDRGVTLTAGDPPVTIGEARWARELNDKLAQCIEANKEDLPLCYIDYQEHQCVRKTKKSILQATLEKIKNCGPDCQRNLNCTTYGGVWTERAPEYHCPHRETELPICERNCELDNAPLVCTPDDRYGLTDCEFHEEAYRRCFKRKEGKPCYDLKVKYGLDPQNDFLFMLAHRFSAAPCRHCNEGTCNNQASTFFEGICTLKGLMAVCDHYEAVSPDHAYTEGVCVYVGSADGKDDRKIFNTSGYVSDLSKTQRLTLCTACRISHSIAKATGLKCLGVRRASKNPLLNESNPLHDHAMQINYMYLTHPEDVAKYQPDVIAQAVYDGITLSCRGLECEEIKECKFNQ